MAYEVRIIQQPRQDLAVVRRRTTFGEIPTFMGSAFEKVAAHLGPKGLLGEGPAMAEKGRELDETTMWEECWSPPGTPDDQTKTVVYCPLKAAA
ncbi:hypothetical protein [Agromyces bauzanensis]|uniref:Uncharacterized protein n=1 Tax=Agromyces bauzanensis TaxID=1308924 RepID=A0A917UX17_9MICO|nr:hypothetical protein [Agromyces bauzanensis]GGJ91897.1 hypothetical protein GCM10011372_32960 [Agromyces bauzanensis]